MSPPTTADPVCQPKSNISATRRRLDMYVMLDANITIPYVEDNPDITIPRSPWDLAATGLELFIRDPRTKGVGVGLRFFGETCEDELYDTRPDVEVDQVDYIEERIRDALASRPTYSSSPMLGAMKGAIKHQKRRAVAFPNWKQIVVFMTDGVTQDFMCRYSASELESATADGYNGTPQIETHLIGFGFSTNNNIADDILARFQPLDSVARAGGSRQAIIVNAGMPPSEMNEALQKVRRQAQPCEFEVPNNTDLDLVKLQLDPDIGELPRVNSLSCGTTGHGWYYDDETAPTKLVLCSVSCALLQSGDLYTARISTGCPPRRR